jgi:hypothetical protein
MRFALVWLCVATAVASAAPKKDAATLRGELDDCKKVVAEIRTALDASKELQIAIDNGKLIYANGGLVSVEAMTTMLTMKAATGNAPSKEELKNFIKNVVRGRAAAKKAIAELVEEDKAERDRVDGKCGKIATELKEAEQGGGGAAVASDDGLQIWIELEGAKNTRTVKTMAESAHGSKTTLQSGPTKYTGHAGVNGTLPAGYTLYITHHSQIWAVLGPTGGGFEVSENKGVGTSNDVEVAACIEGGKKGDPYLPVPKDGDKRARCLGGEGTGVDIQWKP